MKKQGKSVIGYGAAAKGNTLLNYGGIKEDLLSFVCDAAISKQDYEINCDLFLDCNLIESLVHLHTTHRKCKKWVLDTYDTGVKTWKKQRKEIHICSNNC